MRIDDLQRTVLEYPDDDIPRIAYANECGRMGDRDRFEFIHIGIAARDHLRGTRERFEFVQRELALEKNHGASWAGPIAARVNRYALYRGFVST